MSGPNSFIFNFKAFVYRLVLPVILMTGTVGFAFSWYFEKKIILKTSISGAYKVNRILTETYPDEIPIFGSSRAEGGYIPDSLGPAYFNYGLSGTKENVQLFFLEEECKKKKRTPYIILNFDLDGIGYGGGDMANYIPNANIPSVKALMGEQYRFSFRIPFIKYYGYYELYFKYFLNERMNLTKYSNKGASIEKDVLPVQKFNQLVQERKNSQTLFECNSSLKNRLFSLILNHPERFYLFVVAPYHASYFEKYQNLSEATIFLKELAGIKNVRIFNFSKVTYPDSCFLNTTHLNYKGAVLFNRQLKDSLAQIIR